MHIAECKIGLTFLQVVSTFLVAGLGSHEQTKQQEDVML